jgi:hypothetical protein
MKPESDSFYEIAEIVCTPYLVRARRRGGTSDSESPSVSVIWMRGRVPLFLGEHDGGVAVDNRSEYA